MNNHASWLSANVHPSKLRKYSARIAKAIKKDREALQIKAIAVRGVSGMVMGGVVSAKTGLPLIIVRKGEDAHSGHSVEFNDRLGDWDFNYVVVDDLISSGETLRVIREQIKRDTCCTPSMVKVYLYDEKIGNRCTFDRPDIGFRNLPVECVKDPEKW